MSSLLAVIPSHADSVLPLRIFFSVCLVAVILAGVYVFKNRKNFFRATLTSPAIITAPRNLRL
ncbi:MAG: hypothetical protein DMC57_00255 [Verrucomicrobia bacterium]|nr:MAG: hypothetical protein DMC57_00255 [Verrucomicrobiota bacterium]